ncbi:hypothetical protein LDL08_22345 [Nonomuraea glycinis]|uniref:Uncharacterized protein n=1 Tax=Nonomuraea glycinis TaxID=2047744 RepID=A0A918A801_9ACTN|nr:hypothetical protein [Nonomuraea glycinis]MCA2178934.1 hypothetical protein [Nonomuraea glycinis]GGP08341.1 hypothetical protein GCM10012278_39670 [Nonomuraea glycinis]
MQPVHRVTITKTTERHKIHSSKGAFIREIDRRFRWSERPCGLHEVAESTGEGPATQSRA